MKKIIDKVFNKVKYTNRNSPVPQLQNILDRKYGHACSIEMKKPLDSNLNPIPWFTYPAIEFLNQFNLSELNVFEWGSGNSSFYFASKCKNIISVEVDIDWFEKNNDYRKKNQVFILSDVLNFELEIKNYDVQFDIIIIDSIKRKECIELSIKKIKKEGLIILDNSERHPELCEFLRNEGFTEIDFHGFGPINNYTWTTSLFFKSFTLKPTTIQPRIPIGGGY